MKQPTTAEKEAAKAYVEELRKNEAEQAERAVINGLPFSWRNAIRNGDFRLIAVGADSRRQANSINESMVGYSVALQLEDFRAKKQEVKDLDGDRYTAELALFWDKFDFEPLNEKHVAVGLYYRTYGHFERKICWETCGKVPKGGTLELPVARTGYVLRPTVYPAGMNPEDRTKIDYDRMLARIDEGWLPSAMPSPRGAKTVHTGAEYDF